jgi:hypothetical protein
MASFRMELIRAHFEAYRDLQWAETLEPRLRGSGVDVAAIKVFRHAWNDYVETRDWDWWKDEARRMSNKELDDQRMDCLDKLDALGMLQREQARPLESRVTFQDVLDVTARTRDLKPEKSQPRVRAPDR